ncbi:MAG: hypothetical protein Q8R02_03265 [Hyphomonadaceae bacterium]|nr:hypothetical protein [Hyphomonadaceae bacterium]
MATLKRNESATFAAGQPPSCIAGFKHRLLPLMESDFEGSAKFSLACQCGADAFAILSHPLIAPDPSPYYLVEPGEVMFRPPHRLRCASCGVITPVFDAKTQGYDGVLNGGCSYESGDQGEQAAAGAFRITVWFFYNVGLDELEEYAAEASVSPSDLFDSFGLTGEPVGEGDPFEVNYECA